MKNAKEFQKPIVEKTVRFFSILPKETHVDFMGKRFITLTVSAVLCVIGLMAFVQIWLGNANMGLEFTGGAALTLDFEQAVPIDQARDMLAQNGFADAQLQDVKGTNQLSVRTKSGEGEGERVAEQLFSLFQKEFATNKPTLVSTEFIGPTVGKELRDKAVLAVLFATVGLLIYIAVRFDLKFGVAAAMGTFHDVLVVLGITWLSGMEVSLLLITSVLTLAGYSLTDKVTVFDRIRENLKKHHRDQLIQIINTSINQVLARTLLTGVTSLLALGALFFFSGTVLRDFSLILMLGIIIGTYSSIFVASPLLLLRRRMGLTAQVKQ
jgi:preprotein translocase subunit SecF